MQSESPETGTCLSLRNPEERRALAEEAVALHYDDDPALARRYGPAGRAKCVEDAAYHLAYLDEAVASGAPALFLAYLDWARSLLAGLGVPEADLRGQLAVLRRLTFPRLEHEAAHAADAILDAALRAFEAPPRLPECFIDPAAPLGELAERYLAALIAGDRKRAAELVLAAVEAGTPVADVYLEVIQRSQREIGRLWQLSRISVGQEHFCTAASQAIIARLYPHIFAAERADVVGISATMVAHVDAVRRLVQGIRDDARGRAVRILVGGYPFNLAGSLWQAVGADGSAPDARAAVLAQADPETADLPQRQRGDGPQLGLVLDHQDALKRHAGAPHRAAPG